VITTRRIRADLFEASAPLEGITASASTPEVAMEELQTTLAVKAFAAHRMRLIRKATRIAFDPREACYIAECPAAGITARGMTRNDAWERLLYGLRLADQARAAAANEDTDALEADAHEVLDPPIATEPLEEIE
jgi:predicted RNase H-like HicB family nuclease